LRDAVGGLCLGDFAALDAVGADANALAGAVDERLDGLEVDAPAPAGHVVRVGDVVAELRPFAAQITYLRHCLDSKSFLVFQSLALRRIEEGLGWKRIPVLPCGESLVYPETSWGEREWMARRGEENSRAGSR